jgi:hypothetical protein
LLRILKAGVILALSAFRIVCCPTAGFGEIPSALSLIDRANTNQQEEPCSGYLSLQSPSLYCWPLILPPPRMGVTVEEMAVAIPVVTAMAEEEKTAAAKVTEVVRIMETVAAKVTAAEMPRATMVEAVAVTVAAMVMERGADGAARIVGAAAAAVMEGRGEAAARAVEVPRGAVVRGTVPPEELPEEPATQMLGRLTVEEEEPTSEVAKIGKLAV